jgi:hypothetical protein
MYVVCRALLRLIWRSALDVFLYTSRLRCSIILVLHQRNTHIVEQGSDGELKLVPGERFELPKTNVS